MCTVCGCGTASIEGKAHHHDHGPHGHDHHHDDDHHHDHGPDDLGHVHVDGDHIHAGGGIAGVHVPGMSQERIVRIERDILSKNDLHARHNRSMLAETGTLALNFVSSPGSGKTTLLCRLITEMKGEMPIAVIEGDQQTSNDAERIRATGVRAIQINTGKGCHLDAHMVGHALDDMDLEPSGLLLIENVGNLVCPAAFDLGEAAKVVVLSVTEGEDKPLKYPDMFAAADLMILNKSDLLPYLDFDEAASISNALRVNPRLQVVTVSARSGEGLDGLKNWIRSRAASLRTGRAAE